MAPSPLPLLAIIIGTLVFEGLLFGETLAEESFPEMVVSPVTFAGPETDCNGFFDGFVCGIQNLIAFFSSIFTFLVNGILIVYGVILFFISLITFNVPGAPWFVRVPLGSLFGAGIIWSMVTLFRGN